MEDRTQVFTIYTIYTQYVCSIQVNWMPPYQPLDGLNCFAQKTFLSSPVPATWLPLFFRPPFQYFKSKSDHIPTIFSDKCYIFPALLLVQEANGEITFIIKLIYTTAQTLDKNISSPKWNSRFSRFSSQSGSHVRVCYILHYICYILVTDLAPGTNRYG